MLFRSCGLAFVENPKFYTKRLPIDPFVPQEIFRRREPGASPGRSRRCNLCKHRVPRCHCLQAGRRYAERGSQNTGLKHSLLTLRTRMRGVGNFSKRCTFSGVHDGNEFRVESRARHRACEPLRLAGQGILRPVHGRVQPALPHLSQWRAGLDLTDPADRRAHV